MPSSLVIHIHPLAPTKPAAGQACNGCGVCCAWKPCPIGVLISRRLTGPCRALRWHDEQVRYRCGLMVANPGEGFAADRKMLARWWLALWHRLARRWIAAGAGCDSDLQVVLPPASG